MDSKLTLTEDEPKEPTAMQQVNMRRMINYLKRCVKNTFNHPTGESRGFDSNLLRATLDGYLTSLVQQRALNNAFADPISRCVDWRMNKWGDVEFQFIGVSDENKGELDWRRWDVSKLNKSKRTRPRRLVRKEAKRKIDVHSIPIRLYPISPIKHINLTITVQPAEESDDASDI